MNECKICPICGKEILAKAIKCKHCKAIITEHKIDSKTESKAVEQEEQIINTGEEALYIEQDGNSQDKFPADASKRDMPDSVSAPLIEGKTNSFTPDASGISESKLDCLEELMMKDYEEQNSRKKDEEPCIVEGGKSRYAPNIKGSGSPVYEVDDSPSEIAPTKKREEQGLEKDVVTPLQTAGSEVAHKLKEAPAVELTDVNGNKEDNIPSINKAAEKNSFIKKIPGFRTGSWWKAFIAIVLYSFIGLIVLAFVIGVIFPEEPEESVSIDYLNEDEIISLVNKAETMALSILHTGYEAEQNAMNKQPFANYHKQLQCYYCEDIISNLADSYDNNLSSWGNDLILALPLADLTTAKESFKGIIKAEGKTMIVSFIVDYGEWFDSEQRTIYLELIDGKWLIAEYVIDNDGM